MKHALIAAYLLIGLGSWLLCAGWEFAYDQGNWPSVAAKDCRSDSAAGVALSAPAIAVWPILVPLEYLTTGYAEYGWRAPWDLHNQTKMR